MVAGLVVGKAEGMNDEQKNGLRLLLGSLVFAEDDVVSARQSAADLTDAIDVREVLIDRIVDFAELFGGPIAAVLDTTDPRAGLRSCRVQTAGSAFFHRFYIDADHEPSVIVEYPDGVLGIAWYANVRFTDIPESGKEQCSG